SDRDWSSDVCSSDLLLHFSELREMSTHRVLGGTEGQIAHKKVLHRFSSTAARLSVCLPQLTSHGDGCSFPSRSPRGQFRGSRVQSQPKRSRSKPSPTGCYCYAVIV